VACHRCRVPQGGVISPLLLNVALHGMEQALGVITLPEARSRYIRARTLRRWHAGTGVKQIG